jgi:hypothetical protein
MAFRDDLDLTEIMAPFEGALGRAAKAERHTAEQKDVDSPLHMGGEPFCSSSKTLATTKTQVCYDVNGYYRELGVYWTASKGELRVAYDEADGPNDARLTYIFKQLLNKEIRAAYDATPLGEVFLDDYIADALKEKAIREAARRTREGTTYISPEDVLSQWGFDLKDDASEALIQDGAIPDDDQDLEALRRMDDASQVQYIHGWPYGYYLWRSVCMDTERLGRWQELVVDALYEQGSVVRFAVGFCGRQPHPFVVGLVGGAGYVVYLNDRTTADPEIASRAASALLREMTTRHTDESPMRMDTNQMTAAAVAPKFGRGGAAAEAADEAVRKASGKKFHKVPFLSIDDGEYQIVRYLTDSPDWLWVKQHTGAPTKNAPKDYTGNWPESMPATCRYDQAFEGIFSDCYICDAKLQNKWKRPCNPQVRIWAIAVLREEVTGTQEMADAGQIQPNQVGFMVGCRDVYREAPVLDADGKDTGEVKQELALVLVNQPVGNYFEGLQSSFAAYGTVCDRDYRVNRKGSGKDTEYHNISLDKTPNLMPGTDKWQRYLDAIEEQKIDLEKIVTDKASDDFYARFFDPNKEAPAFNKDGDDKGSAPAAQQSAAPSNDVDPDRLAAMRERVKGGAQQAASPAASAPSPDFD